MKCFVTGASGFIGSNLVRELLARGHRVKALLRPGADERALAGLDFERVTGDLFDRALLEHEMTDCQWCFHVAASYHLWMRDYAPMYRVNVEGTRNILEAAGNAKCQKIVYTSTVGCVGLPKENGAIVPANEDEVASDEQLMCAYKRSKFQAEAVALELFKKKDLPIIIVNPSAPVGPGDVRPTPTGKIIVDYLNRRLPAYIDTGLNWVHVRDVAIGHILAAEKGQFGHRYILGNAQGNWTMEETLARLEKITGLPAPTRKLPHWFAMRVAEVSEGIAFFTGKEPQATLAGVRMAQHKMWFDPAKAIQELGLPQTPPEQAFSDAVTWFRTHGYAKAAA
ncbi:MAG TPA: hopanoid-associated sugar epimerase [Verrucomicrobiae bacterium]